MRLDIWMEELFPVPVQRVWHALTDSQMINRWLMRTEDFEAKVGARFTLRYEPQPGFRGYVECQVLELSPPHRMVWSWSSADGGAPTRLVIELEAHGDATRLTLRHTGEADERHRQGHDRRVGLQARSARRGARRPGGLTSPTASGRHRSRRAGMRTVGLQTACL
jgi:uncharacterized protein YndB with AHSA1/START domain